MIHPPQHPLPWFQMNPVPDPGAFSLSNLFTLLRPLFQSCESSWTLRQMSSLPLLEFEGHILVNLSGCIVTGCAVAYGFQKKLKNFAILEQVLPTLKYNPFALRWNVIPNVIASYALNRVLFAQYFNFFSNAVHGQYSPSLSIGSSSSALNRALSLAAGVCTLPFRVAGCVMFNVLNTVDTVVGGIAWEANSVSSAISSAVFGSSGLSYENQRRVSSVLRDLSFTTDFLHKRSSGLVGANLGISYDDIRIDPRSRFLALSAICSNSLHRIFSPIGPAPGFFCLNIALDTGAGETPLSIQHGMRLGLRDVLSLGLALFATHATFNIIRGNWRWVWNGYATRNVDKDMDAMGILGARYTETTNASIFATLTPRRQEVESQLSSDRKLYPTYFQWRYELLNFSVKASILGALHGVGSTVLAMKYFNFCQVSLRMMAPSNPALSASSLSSALPSVAIWATSRAIKIPLTGIEIPVLIVHNLLTLAIVCWSCYPEAIVEGVANEAVGGNLGDLDVEACEKVFRIVTGIPSHRLSTAQLQQFSEFTLTIGLGGGNIQFEEQSPVSTRAGACLFLEIIQVLLAKQQQNASNGLQVSRFSKSLERVENNNAAEDIDCSICLGGYDENELQPFKLKRCGHIFHISCLSQWIAAQHQCPLCRDSITVEPLAPTSDSSEGDEPTAGRPSLRLPSLYGSRIVRGFSPMTFRPRLTRSPAVRLWIDNGVENGDGSRLHTLLTQGVFLAGLTDLGWVFTRGSTCSGYLDCAEDAVDYMREVLLAEVIVSPLLRKIFGDSIFSPAQKMDLSTNEFGGQHTPDNMTGPAPTGESDPSKERIRKEALERQHLLFYGKFWVVCMVRMRSLHQSQLLNISAPWHRLVYTMFAMSVAVLTPLL